jgi:hypothetical protein
VVSENSVFQEIFSLKFKERGKFSSLQFQSYKIKIFTLKRKINSQKNHRCKICPKIEKNSGGEWGTAFKI